MSRRIQFCAMLAMVYLTLGLSQALAALLLYEPFDYPTGDFLSATTIGTENSTTRPIGYLAPNNNNWYGTGIAAGLGGYQSVNDSPITNNDLTVSGLAKPNSTRALSMGGTGYTYRLSLNQSIGLPNQTATNLTDTPDPLAGTDPTLQATDTAGTGYYSLVPSALLTSRGLTLKAEFLQGSII